MYYAQASSSDALSSTTLPVWPSGDMWNAFGTSVRGEGLTHMSWIIGTSEEKLARSYSDETYLYFWLSFVAFFVAVAGALLSYLISNPKIELLAGGMLLICSFFGFLWIESGKKDVRKNIY